MMLYIHDITLTSLSLSLSIYIYIYIFLGHLQGVPWLPPIQDAISSGTYVACWAYTVQLAVGCTSGPRRLIDGFFVYIRCH